MCSNVSYGACSQIFKCKYFVILPSLKGRLYFLFHLVRYSPPSLQDAREDLRCSMAKDMVTIRNETLKFNGDNIMENLSGGTEATLVKDISSDFQKKLTFTKHDKGDKEAGFLYGNDETYRKMAGMF